MSPPSTPALSLAVGSLSINEALPLSDGAYVGCIRRCLQYWSPVRGTGRYNSA